MLPALHLPATTPVEGFWKKRSDPDYEKNKAEFGEDVAVAWRNVKKMIKNNHSTWLRSVLQNESGEAPYEKLLSMRLYFKGALKSLVDIAEYYLDKEVNTRRKESRSYILNNLKSWSQEYNDFMKNRAEFGEDNARRWREVKKVIMYKQHESLRDALQPGEDTYQDLFSLRMYFKGRLTTLVQLARHFGGKYYDVDTSQIRYIADDLEELSEEYYENGGARPPETVQPYFVNEKSRQEHMNRGFAGVNLR